MPRAALEQELKRLQDWRGLLEQRIAFARVCYRVGDPADSERAREEERAARVELEGVLRQITAAEAKLVLLKRAVGRGVE